MNVILIFNKFTDAYIGMTYGTDAMSLTEAGCDDTHFKYKTDITTNYSDFGD